MALMRTIIIITITILWEISGDNPGPGSGPDPINIFYLHFFGHSFINFNCSKRNAARPRTLHTAMNLIG